MANVSVTVPESNITVDTTNSIVTVSETTSNIIVGQVVQVSNAAVRAAISASDTGGDGSLSYSSSTGIITYTGPSAAEVRAHFSATTPVTYSSSTGDIAIDSSALFTGKTTDDLAEGSTNLYFTDVRATASANSAITAYSGYMHNLSGAADVPNNLAIIADGNVIINDQCVVGENFDPMMGMGAVHIQSTGYGANIVNHVYTWSPDDPAHIPVGFGWEPYSARIYQIYGDGNYDTGNATIIAIDSDELEEGSTNLYYTTAKANSAILGYTGAMPDLTGNITTTANISGGNILGIVAGVVDTTSNITTTANVSSAGFVTTGNATVGANLLVSGNLEVTGNINYREVTDLLVQDQTITMNYGNASAQDAQIIVDRSGSTLANVDIKWNETADEWQFTNDGTLYSGIGGSIGDDLTLRSGATAAGNATIYVNTGTVISGNGIIGWRDWGDGKGNWVANYQNANVAGANEGNVVIGGISDTFLQAAENIDGYGLSKYSGNLGSNDVYTGEAPSEIYVRNTVYATGFACYDTSDGVLQINDNGGNDDAIDINMVLRTTNDAGALNSSGMTIFGNQDAAGPGIGNLRSIVRYDGMGNVTTYLDHGSADNANTNTNHFTIHGIGDNDPIFKVNQNSDITIGGVTTSDANITTTANVSASSFIGDGGVLTYKQPFGSGTTLTDVADIEGDGYHWIDNNTTGGLELITYSGSAEMTSYLFNGNVALGDANIVVSSMNDKQGDASVVTADVIDQYMVMTNAFQDTDMAPFPMGTYVLSATGSNVTMSANALATYEFDQDLFNPGIVDTTRNQAISLISDYAADDGSNTSIKYSIATNPDAFGYPASGWVVGDFAGFSHGSSGDYAFSGSQEAYFKGRTDIMPANTTLNVQGLSVGAATMTGRGENDSLSSFGINALWDGVTSSGYDSQIPQILLKAYNDLTLGSVSSYAYKEAAGPRLFLAGAYGNADDYAFNAYPRANQELGRIAFSGTTGNNLSPSTIQPPAYLSVQAADDWTATGSTTAGNTDLYLNATADKNAGADIILAYKAGQLILAPGKTNAGNHESIIFTPAQQGGITPSGTYSGNYAQWGTINYANVAGETGSKITVTNGGSSGVGVVGDLELSVFRNDVTDGGSNVSVANEYNAIGNNYYSNLSGYGSDAPTLMFGTYAVSVDLSGLVSGQIATFDDYTGTLGTEINGNAYYVKLTALSGAPFYGQYLIGLFTDAGLSSPVTGLTATSPGNYGAGTMEWTAPPTVTDRSYTFRLQEQEEKLELITVNAADATTSLVEFTEARTEFTNSLKLKNYTTTQINALTGMEAGDVVYNTTLEQICFYDGTATAWQKVTSATM